MGNAASAPVINDVTTIVEDPPTFVKSNHPIILSTKVKESIIKHYADIQTLRVPNKDVAAVFAACKEAVSIMPKATIVYHNEVVGVIEIVDVTALFRFKDDMVVRVRQEGVVVAVDARSASRLGKGDLGKNAGRLREYLGALEKRLGLTPNVGL